MSFAPEESAQAAVDVAVEAGKPPIVRAPPAQAESWLADHSDALRSILSQHGAVLIRGLRPGEPDRFGQVSRELVGEPMAEREAFAPRKSYRDGVYSSSSWPADQPMCLHNELSYALVVPRLILFSCVVPPAEGGATVIADGQRVLADLPAELVAGFERLGWSLTRHYREVLGVSWAEALGTASRGEAESYLRANAIDFEWHGDGDLRTRQLRAAVVRHPLTGQRCWFNQIAFLNRWTLDPDVRDYLLALYGPDGLPFDSRWGNGDPISAELIGVIHDRYSQATVREPWQAGDLLWVDNIRMAHGREPFHGPREVRVAMGAPVRIAGRVPAVTLPAGR